MNILWPASDESLLVWSQLLLTWVVAMYYAGRTESVWGRTQLAASRNWYTALPRFALLILVPIALTGRRVVPTALLVLIGCALATLLMWAREKGNERWRSRGAELEIGITGVYVAMSAIIAGNLSAHPLISLLRLPMSERRIAALCFAAAILGFFVRGGTQIVRAILNKAGSLPRKAEQVDEVEYNRGRLVGSIERLLLAGMVAAGSYAALAFTIAAKGLVRSKEFENRNFAEYFLIGTLASTALAMAAGGLLRLVFIKLW